MFSLEDTKAMTEVLEYLKTINEDDVKKIAPVFIEYLKENASKDYKPDIDFTKPLSFLNLMPNTKAIITFICYKYWCQTEEERALLKKTLDLNSKNLVTENNWDNIFDGNEKKEKYSLNEVSIFDVEGLVSSNTEIIESITERLDSKYNEKFKVLRIGNRYGTDRFSEATAYCGLEDKEIVFEVLYDMSKDIIKYDDYYIKKMCYELEEDLRNNIETDLVVKTGVFGKSKLDSEYTIADFFDKYKSCNLLTTIVLKNRISNKELMKAYEKIKEKYENIYLKSLLFVIEQEDFQILKEKAKTLTDLSLTMIEKYNIKEKHIITIQNNEIIKIK